MVVLIVVGVWGVWFVWLFLNLGELLIVGEVWGVI